jgi:phosphate transport system ATP-binding protein
MTLAKIAVTDLRATIGPVEALRGITISMAPNEVLAIIGPSGAGKSTFLRCLNRMHETRPGATTSGRVELDGLDIHAPDIDPVWVRRRVGLVFQRPNPLPMLSISENVVAGLTLAGEKVERRSELVETMLRRVALWNDVKDRLDRPGTSLSSGQQQRLCIARALALRPDVLLMDEPCSALDPIATARIEELLNELRSHVTMAIVTHNLQQAARVADSTAFFHEGTLVEHDRANVIFTNPNDPRTEDYITGRFG